MALRTTANDYSSFSLENDISQVRNTWKGPRNLPKPDERKRRRTEVKKSRKLNRGVYSGR